MACVLVTAATGRLGRQVVPALRAAGHDVRAGTRSPAGDVRTDYEDDASLRAALAGVDVVLHLATNPRAVRSQTDAWLAERLLTARAAAAPDSALLMLSIVGCDRTPLPYYRAKARAERMVAGAGGHIVRATQFHGFLASLVAPAPLVHRAVVPAGWRVQPVAETFVADVLVVAVGDPAGAPREVAGPEALDLAQAAARLGPRPWQVPLPGALSRAVRGGSLLPGAGALAGGPGFGPA